MSTNGKSETNRNKARGNRHKYSNVYLIGWAATFKHTSSGVVFWRMVLAREYPAAYGIIHVIANNSAHLDKCTQICTEIDFITPQMHFFVLSIHRTREDESMPNKCRAIREITILPRRRSANYLLMK